MTLDQVREDLTVLRRRVDQGDLAAFNVNICKGGIDVLRAAKRSAEMRLDAEAVAKAFGLKLGEI